MSFVATQPPDDLQAFHEEGVSLRETLYADVVTLIRRGFINEATIKDLKGPNGYKNVATDLQILASLLKDNWAQIEGKCAVQMAELEHALKLAARILRVVGLREQGPVVATVGTVPAAGNVPGNGTPSAVNADKSATVGMSNHGPFMD